MEIAFTFESLGFESLYLADLDAILGKPANFSLYQQIVARTNLELMVDAGISDIAKAKKVLETGVKKIIVGSETLSSLDFLNKAVKSSGEDKVTVSIDMKEGKVLSLSETIKSMSSASFAQKLADVGIKQIILLDLSRVGTEHGTNSTVLESILEKTSLEVFVGGGIKDIQELEELRRIGISGALIATILQNGKLKIEELKSNNFLE
jgi:phosphoribosylformimino-5-aminoimidazole carboxamide ribotide isomerase